MKNKIHKMQILKIKTNHRFDVVDLTSDIQTLVSENGLNDGILLIYSPHTSATVTINEHYDPTVVEDIQNALRHMIPKIDFKHLEGNSDAHIKTSLIGNSVQLIVEDNKILLGRWQRVLFFEFDGPRTRELWIKFIGE